MTDAWRREAAAPAEALALMRQAGRLGLLWRDAVNGAERWDEGLFRIVGLEASAGEPPGGLMACLHPQDAARAGAAHLPQRCRALRPDGEVRYLQLLQAEPGWTLVIDDTEAVTASRLQRGDKGASAERAAEEAMDALSLLERMQLVAETIGVGFWWRDLDAGVFEWDEQMYRMHHRLPSEGPPNLDEWIERHVHPADRGWMAARQDVHYAQWTPASDVVFRTLAPDGSERWIQSWTRRLMRDGHRVTLGIHVDITDRRRAEQRFELERQRDQFAIDAAGIGVWERRVPDGKPVYWSPMMYRLRGLDPDDRRRLPDIVRATMSPADDAEAFRRLERCIETGDRFSYEFEVTWPDGTRRWLSSTGRAVRDANGMPVVVAGINVDVTERRQLDQLARERDRAEQASAAKSELMARVSHELRTPMNAVLGFADLMAHDMQAALAPAQGERLARIRSAGAHLLDLIDDLLELSRADPGGRSEPARSEQAAVAPPPVREAEPAAAEPLLRVLYIEDNPVNEMLVREMLALRPGIALESAADGASGVAEALARTPDLILLDLQLPDMSGIEVMRRLRGEASLAGCRFVALSANAMPEDVSQALQAGFNEYWTKPLNLAQFLADMDALVRNLERA